MKYECRIRQDTNLALIPENPSGPPSWYPAFAGIEGIYVPRKQFEAIKKHLIGYPCEHCPKQIKSVCSTYAEICEDTDKGVDE